MNDQQQNTVSVLNSLIETNEDGHKGFLQASEHVNTPELKSTFNSFATRRANFAAELRDQVRTLGGTPSEEGTTAGSVHRGWISLKEALSTQDAEAVLEECERGEEHALEQYRDALESELPANIRPVVERQMSTIREAKSEISQLEEKFDDNTWSS